MPVCAVAFTHTAACRIFTHFYVGLLAQNFSSRSKIAKCFDKCNLINFEAITTQILYIIINIIARDNTSSWFLVA